MKKEATLDPAGRKTASPLPDTIVPVIILQKSTNPATVPKEPTPAPLHVQPQR